MTDIDSPRKLLETAKQLHSENKDDEATKLMMNYTKRLLTSSDVDGSKEIVEIFLADFIRDGEIRTSEEASNIVIILSMTKWCERDKRMKIRGKLKDQLRQHIRKVSGESEARTALARL